MDFYQQTLFKILKLQGSFEVVLDELVKLVSSELDISRVSVWRGSSSAGGIACLALYDKISHKVEKGLFLSAQLYPSYFSAINKTVCLNVEDAREDQRTSEFLNNYLLPLSIFSMLDAPIIVNGEVKGVICFEQVYHKRTWTNDELILVSEIAQFVAQQIVQEERRVVEEKFTTIVENSLDAIYFFKTIRNQNHKVVDLVLQDLNPSAVCEQKKEKDSLVGRSLLEVFSNYDMTKFFQLYLNTADSGQSFEKEYSVIDENNMSYAYLHLVQHIKDGIVIFSKNLTIRKRFEEKLVDEKDKVLSIVNAFPMMLFVKNRQGHYIQVNELFCNFLELPPDEVIGKNVYDFFAANESQLHQYVDLKVLRTGNNEVYECKTKMPNGQYVNVVLTKAPLRDSHGSIIGIIGVGQDVTEQRRAENQHKRLQAQMVQSSKLTSIGTLATGIAHEINNPLTVILGFLGVLEEILDERQMHDSDLKAATQSMHSALERIRIIVKELRTYARSDSEKLEYVDFHESLNSTLLLCKNLFEKENIFIKLDLNCNRPLFSGNRSATQQAIMNILSNARDAILDAKRGGEIFVRTSLDRGHILVDFIDNGCGISPENLPKIFDPFFTTKEPSRGSGLGLGIVQIIVQNAGGEIQIQSEIGKGTSLRLRLPLADIVRPIDENAKMDHLKSKARYKVLVVDDEKDIVTVIQTILQPLGFDIDAASNGRDALSMMFKDIPYDLVISDFRIPGLDGDKMFTEAKLKGFSGKSLLITGLLADLSTKRIEEISFSVDDVLRKPFDKEMLINVLKRMGFILGV